MRHHFFLLVILLAAVGSAAAMEFEPVANIEAAALAAVAGGGGDVEAEASVDPALRLPACPAGLAGQAANAGTVEVRCTDASGWRLFVPVRVRRSQDVLVLVRNVAAGATLSEADFVVESRDAGRILGAPLTDAGSAVGRSARRLLQAGTVLAANDLMSPRLVRRGDSVTLVSREGGLEIRMAGRALGDGGVDDRVTVENASSRRVVQGRVGPGGEVLVGR
ncbi:flagellar basal body P-ring formation chaperone FlgA [Coralloluteibacterium stylophorae]|uniref:Flagella basal body P-ring formation protein FlgA n=1 Tax=Coralloluteibacterium stylophorae TaxID=1776034 RepID=A0A8J8AZI5_9GAMM|nr:flagellar basal body P-ring formation chaperone FlgA [Coralloluteibacterium stylophorae]MBS7457192.1 flagellar basal body P-ring formation protein FlgA [Coralloluteibacterium stylophorae]